MTSQQKKTTETVTSITHGRLNQSDVNIQYQTKTSSQIKLITATGLESHHPQTFDNLL